MPEVQAFLKSSWNELESRRIAQEQLEAERKRIQEVAEAEQKRAQESVETERKRARKTAEDAERRNQARIKRRTILLFVCGFAALVILGLICCLIAFNSMEQAKNDLAALQIRADSEPTAFLWEYFSADENDKRSATLNRSHENIVMDKFTESEIQFHSYNSNSPNFYLWRWKKDALGPKGTYTRSHNQETDRFDVLSTSIANDRINISPWDPNNSKNKTADAILRNREHLRLFAPRGWVLYAQGVDQVNKDYWQKCAVFETSRSINTKQFTSKAAVSSSQLWSGPGSKPGPFGENTARLMLLDEELVGLMAYSWPQSTDEEKWTLNIQIEESTFVNGPIIMSGSNSIGTKCNFLLLRY